MTSDRPTRGRKGRIDALDDDLRSLVNRHLRGGLPLTEIRDRVNVVLVERGDKPLSYSSLNRYASRVERVGSRMREAREMADVWTSKFGEDPGHDIGKLMVDMLHTAAFDAMTRLEDADEELDAETINTLALGMQRLARAAEISAKREREIRAAAAAEAAREAQRRGLSAKAADALRAHVAEFTGA